jgi:glycosyltransferase involved in cell wall biosynthesis
VTLRVAQVITGLETGGAEMLLVRMVERLREHDVEGPVITLRHARGALAGEVEDAGVEVIAVQMSSPPTPPDFLRLRRAIVGAEADVVQTWLLHANVFAALAAPRRQRLVWGVHMSQARADTHGRTTIALQRLERLLSGRVPDRIIATSHSSRDEMLARGYDPARMELVPNGFDTERFRPDRDRGERVRTELGIAPDAPVVGHFARYHPMKDHRNLLAAVPVVRERVRDAVFLLCGDGVDPSNRALAPIADGLGGAVRLLGPRSDVEALLDAVDVSVSSSTSGEAMPVVIGEAMAAGVPFVATDVADAHAVIADTGKVVPPGDPMRLGAAIADVLLLPDAERSALGEAARRRILDRYPVADMVSGYVRIWREVAAAESATGA